MNDREAIAEIRRGLDLLYTAGDVIELRAFKRFKMKGVERTMTISGFFDDLNELACSIHEVNKLDGGLKVYTTLNPVTRDWMVVDNQAYDPKSLKRAIRKSGVRLEDSPRLSHEKNLRTGKTWHKIRTTSDADILERHWILIDVDAGQPTDCNSTDAEKQEAFDMTLAVVEFLQSRGFAAPAVCDSGNGWHVLVRCSLPNTIEMTDTVRRFLGSLASKFDGEFGTSHIDRVVYNAARITKSYGTLVTKGKNTPERPHRRSCVKSVGSKTPVTLEQIQMVANEYAPAKGSALVSTDRVSDVGNIGNIGDVGDLAREVKLLTRYLDFNDIEHGDALVSGGVIRIPIICPNSAEHTTTGTQLSTFVSVFPNGAFGFKCHHAHCSDIDGWSGFKEFVNKKFADDNPGALPFKWSGTVVVGPASRAAASKPGTRSETAGTQGSRLQGGKIIKDRRKKTRAVSLLKELCQPRCRAHEAYKRAKAEEISRSTLRKCYAKAGVTPYGDGINACGL